MPGKRKSKQVKNAKASKSPKGGYQAGLVVPNPPVAAGFAMGGDTFHFGSSGKDIVTVVGTATVGVSTASATKGIFQATELDLDPGALPRLGDLAKAFTQYRYKEFQIESIPLLGTATSGVGGASIAYDATQTAPTTLVEAGRNPDNVLGPAGLGYRLRLQLKHSQLPWYELKGTEKPEATDRMVSQFKAWAVSEGLPDASAKYAVVRIGYRVDLKGSR